MRKCIKCNKEFPLSEEYFHRNHANKGGFLYTCKTCKKIVDKKYREKNKNKYHQQDLIRKRRFKQQKGIYSSALHKFIRNNKAKQQFCTICNEPKKVELASINHTYTRNPEDYIWLCRSCHRLFDRLTEEVIIV